MESDIFKFQNNQGSDLMFGLNAGKQCVAMPLSLLCMQN